VISRRTFLAASSAGIAGGAALPPRPPPVCQLAHRVLPEIVEAVNGRVPVLIDGGLRRGTDVFKACNRSSR
jgi:hypothetical protein